jgi:purine-binding chemotaxis protein CheW
MTTSQNLESGITEFVTAVIGGQLFGLAISGVQDVFVPERLSRVPLASRDVAGVLNLRGRIVTAIDMRSRLGLPKRNGTHALMAIGVDLRGESYGLLIDTIGEVLKFADDGREPNPVNLDARMAKMAAGIHRHGEHLMVVLDVDRVLDFMPDTMAA